MATARPRTPPLNWFFVSNLSWIAYEAELTAARRRGQLLANVQPVPKLEVAITEQEVGPPTPADRRVGIARAAAALFASGEENAEIGAGGGKGGSRVDADASGNVARIRHFFRELLIGDDVEERPAQDRIARRPIAKMDGRAAQGHVLALNGNSAARIQPRAELQTPARLHVGRESCRPRRSRRFRDCPVRLSRTCCWDWRSAPWSPAEASPSPGSTMSERQHRPSTAPRDEGTGSKIVHTAARTARRSRRRQGQALRHPFPPGPPARAQPAGAAVWAACRSTPTLGREPALPLANHPKEQSPNSARRRFRRGIVEGHAANFPVGGVPRGVGSEVGRRGGLVVWNPVQGGLGRLVAIGLISQDGQGTCQREGQSEEKVTSSHRNAFRKKRLRRMPRFGHAAKSG